MGKEISNVSGPALKSLWYNQTMKSSEVIGTNNNELNDDHLNKSNEWEEALFETEPDTAAFDTHNAQKDRARKRREHAEKYAEPAEPYKQDRKHKEWERGQAGTSKRAAADKISSADAVKSELLDWGGGQTITVAEQEQQLEQERQQKQLEGRKLGAKILSQVGFHGRHEDIVESSFEKARRAKEKLVGKNAARRSDAYLQRLEKLVAKYGNKAEQELWDLSADKLVIDPDDIEDGYWKSQEQILRDEGHGRKLSDYDKEFLTGELRKQQRESLRHWADYLGDEATPYPMWFKVYAWDGMSKMGVFDKEKGEFKKRNQHTVAPYPKLNQAALGKVYGAINNFYKQERDKRKNKSATTKEDEEDVVLDALVKSGSFNKLYSYMFLHQKVAPKTPERTEDVHGQWIEYLPGQEEEVAVAAEGTPWCVAAPDIAKSYLETGTNGQNDWDNEDYSNDSKAKFILFHLQDPETGLLAENACASIRLGTDGKVAEISGLKEGQALEDSLVPIVEEKVKTLPGGEKFLKAFADKKKLIALDRRMQDGNALTGEDAKFIFGEIHNLDYNERDPRIGELQTYYLKGLNSLSQAPISADDILKHMDTNDVVDNVDTLIKLRFDAKQILRYDDPDHRLNVGKYLVQLAELGASGNTLVQHMGDGSINEHLDDLIKLGTNGDTLVKHINEDLIIEHFDDLIKLGARDETIMDYLSKDCIGANFGRLVEAGFDDGVLVEKMDTRRFKYLDTLLKHGVSMDTLMRGLVGTDVNDHFDELLEAGESIEVLIEGLGKDYLPEKFDRLVELGASGDALVQHMRDSSIAERLDDLIELGTNGDALVQHLDDDLILENIDDLIKLGAHDETIASRLNPDFIGANFDRLVEAGIDDGVLVEGMASLRFKYFDKLLEHGVSMDALMRGLDSFEVNKHFDELLEAGVSADALAEGLSGWRIPDKFDRLLELGVSAEKLADLMFSYKVNDFFDRLVELGVSKETLVHKMSLHDMAKHIDQLEEMGVNKETLRENLDPASMDDYLMELGGRIDQDFLAERINGETDDERFHQLVELITDGDALARNMVNTYKLPNYYDVLVKLGASGDALVPLVVQHHRYDDTEILKRLDDLIELGAHDETIVNNLSEYFIASHFGRLLRAGIDGEAMAEKNPYIISDHLDELVKHGANVDNLVQKMPPSHVRHRLNQLVELGADKELLAEKMKSGGYDFDPGSLSLAS